MGRLKWTAAVAQLFLAIGAHMAIAQSPRLTITGDSGRANLVVSSGQELELRLSANPTTGYTWQFDLGEHAHLDLKSRHYQAIASGAVPQLGAGGIQCFVFEAVSAGTEHLQFEYRRGDTGQPTRIFELNVIVSR